MGYLRGTSAAASRAARESVRLALGWLGLAIGLLPATVQAVPSFARQTDLPCARCHVQAFGPALSEFGRQFKLNGYVLGSGEQPLPLALMIQGGFSRSDAAQPAPAAPHFSANDNLALDQVSLFIGTRLSEHAGMLGQATYSGEKRHFAWDNTDVRYARQVGFFGTDAVVGVSINNNPTVQDLWNSTPAWGFPYIASPLLPAPAASPVVTGALAQLVLGATAYAMVRGHLYAEAGAYRGLPDRWLDNVGLYPSSSANLVGAAPYWRLAYQDSHGPHYFSLGTFGLDVKIRPDRSVTDTNRFTDLALDAVYQYSGPGPGAVLVNASYIHERQDLTATFRAAGAAAAGNHLEVLRVDASYIHQQTFSAGLGLFDSHGGADTLLYAPAPLTGSASGSPDSRGYLLQLEYIPFGKESSWGRPWVNVRVGLQYTGYLRFNGGTSGYDGFGRSSRQNNSTFLFVWMAF